MNLYLLMGNMDLDYVMVNVDFKEGSLEDMNIGIMEERIQTLDYELSYSSENDIIGMVIWSRTTSFHFQRKRICPKARNKTMEI